MTKTNRYLDSQVPTCDQDNRLKENAKIVPECLHKVQYIVIEKLIFVYNNTSIVLVRDCSLFLGGGR